MFDKKARCVCSGLFYLTADVATSGLEDVARLTP
jgi:hypothetical protein